MATQVQNRRGTTAEHSTFTGAVGELTVDTTKDTVVVHDGAVAGGRPLLREDQSNLPTSAPTTGIYNASGSLAISTGGSGRLFVNSNGNLGVGTSSTGSSKFYVLGDTTNYGVTSEAPSGYGSFTLKQTSGNSISLGMLSNGLFVYDNNAATTRLTLDSSGRLGVGTSTFGNADADDLTVAGSGNTGITVRAGTTSASNIYFADGTTGDDAVRGYFAYNHSADRLTIGTNAATAVTIDSSQRVGIGTTSPGQALHVIGNIQVGDSGNERGIYVGAAGFSGAFLYRPTGDIQLSPRSGYGITFAPAPGSATEWGRWDSSGRLLVGTSSDSGGALLQVNGDRIRVGTAKTPASATATGTTGEICWDASYVYVCTATNTWKRSALSTW